MKKLFLSTTTLLFCLCASAALLQGHIVGVSDGDTVTLLDHGNQQHKIRLAGIDAPEKTQPFGNRSKQSLSDLTYNRHVLVQASKQDRYGRTVGTVLVDGQDVNLIQIQRGMAWHYKAYKQEQSPEDAQKYANAEELARTNGLGLWVDHVAEPPWDYRRAKKAKE